MNYYFKKNFYSPKDVEFAYLFFDNGDYITVDKKEIIDFDFEFYDKMVWYQDSIVPVAKFGFVKLKISKLKSSRYDSIYMNKIKDYNRNRKKYIENFCCNDNPLVSVKFFNDNNCSKSVYGQFNGKMDGEYLVLSSIDIWPNISSNSDKFSISLHSVNKSIINKITLDFENCETIDVFQDEIVDLQLNLNEKLEEYSNDYLRKIKNGFIKIKFNSEIDYRHVLLFSDVKNIKVKHLKKRLLGNKDKMEHDICRLYINYDYAGFGIVRNEPIVIDENWIEQHDYDYYISGYCEELENDEIVIHFDPNVKVI